jgi:hypothetical protein
MDPRRAETRDLLIGPTIEPEDRRRQRLAGTVPADERLSLVGDTQRPDLAGVVESRDSLGNSAFRCDPPVFCILLVPGRARLHSAQWKGGLCHHQTCLVVNHSIGRRRRAVNGNHQSCADGHAFGDMMILSPS